MPEEPTTSAVDRKLDAEAALLLAQAEHFRAQATAIHFPLTRSPAIWSIVGTILVGVVGYVATFRSQAYSDLVALKETQLGNANAQLPKLEAQIKQASDELQRAEAQRKNSEKILSETEDALRDAKFELKAANQQLQRVSEALKANPDRVRTISRTVAESGDTTEYIKKVFGTQTDVADREKIKTVVGFVVGRTMRDRQAEIEPLLRNPTP